MTDAQAHQPGEHEGVGMALGFRIFEHEGEMFMAEAEVTSYMDDPQALGATVVFHPLADIDPTSPEEEDDEDDTAVWHVDVDDQLTRDEKAPIREQFQAILRQLAALSEGELRELLDEAREQAGIEDE
jgi:hypothetical protein